jgi:hypothetical protein
MERWSYIESEDRLVCETIYDAESALAQAEEARSNPVQIGKKGQELVLAAVIPAEHITALKNQTGLDLLSPDPDMYRWSTSSRTKRS